MKKGGKRLKKKMIRIIIGFDGKFLQLKFT